MARLKITLTRYNPVLRFRLSDAETRHFIVSRMCFRGDSPRWLKLEDLSLAEGCDRYFPHLGRESFYELNLGGLA